MNDSEPPIDVETMAIERRREQPSAQPANAITAVQARIEAVADLTRTAMAQAGTLKLTPEETQALTADFGDDAFRSGAGGKENLIYIEHAALRDRLNSVLGLGQWAIIVRETWNEDFKIPAKGGYPEKAGVRVYSRAMLLVRGAYVGEAVGDMDYFPHNASQNYGDAFEGSKTAAFRRCAKEFGIGLQAWRKDWCDSWWQRHQGNRSAPATPAPRPAQRPAQAPAAAPAPRQPAKPAAPTKGPDRSAEWKKHYLSLVTEQDVEIFAYAIAIDDGWVIPGVDKLMDIDPHKLPQINSVFDALWARILKCRDLAQTEGLPQVVTEAYEAAYKAPTESPREGPGEAPAARKAAPAPRAGATGPDAPDAPWRAFVVPFGRNKGIALAEVDKKALYGFWANFQPSDTWENSQGQQVKTSPANLARDRTFRAMLDEAGKHYNFADGGNAAPAKAAPAPSDNDEDEVPF